MLLLVVLAKFGRRLEGCAAVAEVWLVRVVFVVACCWNCMNHGSAAAQWYLVIMEKPCSIKIAERNQPLGNALFVKYLA